MSRSAGAKAISRAGRDVGLPGVGWHDFRHTFATLLLSSGVVNPAAVAKAMGHSLPTLLRTYSHCLSSDQDRMRQVVDGALGLSQGRDEAAS